MRAIPLNMAHLAYGLASRDELVVVIVYQTLPLAVQFSDLCQEPRLIVHQARRILGSFELFQCLRG